MDLSIVVIGRNESANIDNIVASIEKIGAEVLSVEKVFVDSASTDNSVELARKAFDVVAELEESPYLCASAGRTIGTNVASGRWLLYLDADMTLAPEFALSLPELMASAGPGTAGYIGTYIHVFDDGSRRSVGFSSKDSTIASGLGGASLLRKSAVLAAGNWDPGIFAHEELDLFARLKDRGLEVIAIKTPMILHFTEKLSKTENLLRLFFPNGGSGKKYYGAGQLWASRWFNSRSGMDILRIEPYTAIIALGLLAALMLALLGHYPAALLLVVLTVFGISAVTRLVGFIIYFAMLARTPFGILKYRRDAIPTISSIWQRQ